MTPGGPGTLGGARRPRHGALSSDRTGAEVSRSKSGRPGGRSRVAFWCISL